MLRMVVRVELKVFVSVCGFSVDFSFYSSIEIPGLSWCPEMRWIRLFLLPQ